MNTTPEVKEVAAMLRRSWPVAVAAAALLIASVAAVWTWAAVAQRQDHAVEAAWAVEAAERRTAEATDAIPAVDADVVLTGSEVVVLEGMLQPGMAEALGGVYLMAAVLGCEAGSEVDPSSLVDRIPEEAIPPTLAVHDGWEAAIDTRAIEESLEDCDG